MKYAFLICAALALAPFSAHASTDDMDRDRLVPVAVEPAVADEPAEAEAVPAPVPTPQPAPKGKAAAGKGKSKPELKTAAISQPATETDAVTPLVLSGVPKVPFGDRIAHHARENGVPVALAVAVVRIESNFNPKLKGGCNCLGLMQIMPSTARAIGYSGPPQGLYDPETNLRFGMKYLGQAHKMARGDTCRTVLKYQAGHRQEKMTAHAQNYCNKAKGIMAGLR